MNKMILALGLLLGSLTVHAAELQIFENYDPAAKTYTAKYFSTSEAPLSAEYLLSNYAVCYKGDSTEVLDLVNTMVGLYNLEATADEQILTHDASFFSVDNNDYLTMSFKTKTWLNTYAQIRRCIR